MSIRKATPKKRSSADRKRAIEQIETVIATERESVFFRRRLIDDSPL
jgi:hypothetical protein